MSSFNVDRINTDEDLKRVIEMLIDRAEHPEQVRDSLAVLQTQILFSILQHTRSLRIEIEATSRMRSWGRGFNE